MIIDVETYLPHLFAAFRRAGLGESYAPIELEEAMKLAREAHEVHTRVGNFIQTNAFTKAVLDSDSPILIISEEDLQAAAEDLIADLERNGDLEHYPFQGERKETELFTRWVNDVEPTSEEERKWIEICKQEFFEVEDLEIIVKAVLAFRAYGRIALHSGSFQGRRGERLTKTAYVGHIQKKIVNGVCVYTYVLQDLPGNAYASQLTGSPLPFSRGEQVKFTATVKGHTTIGGVPTTVLAFVDIH